ncbi:glyoxalase/bleomycin resistance/extradiol dioxygenase family protein [Methylobacterium sp. R2-1]|uniref:VOC family protein n=1 Tax=Methylobacterium sp. R2-1 TaxID=2587064 RepID=UPI001615B934|nr:glyoxalase/bleomycin resistance/extradiol dioxygenase family protein [Methylobacterium sp. R2-1]MBB2962050.1 putative glyoxalase superfamily protein PhnB [Methylobacterium sp. R2-1]
MSGTDATQPGPAVPPRGGVVAYLTLDGALRAAAFYQKAFGAEILASIPPDEKGRTMHVHLVVNGTSVMLSDAFPEHGHPLRAPQAFSLLLPVDDIAAWWDQAVAAGAEVVMPYQEMFWGDVYGQLRDPFGVIWAMNQPKRAA